MTAKLFDATRPFNWQPQEHYGPEGSEDYSEWTTRDFEVAERFLDLTSQEIRWQKPTADWITESGVKGEPDWVAETAEGLFVIGQNIWLGFPDPPEFTIVQLLPQDHTRFHLGHFDNWPQGWVQDAAN